MPARDQQADRVLGFIRFSARDYKDLARAARAIAKEYEDLAAAQPDPAAAKMFNACARRHRELSQKCELAARVL